MRKFLSLSLAATLISMMSSNSAPAAPANVEGHWGQLFQWPLIPLHLVMLPSGKIFSYGIKESGPGPGEWTYTIWDPALGIGDNSIQILPYNANNNTDIFCSSAALIPSTGEVLIAGGDTRTPSNIGVPATQIFSPEKKTLDRSFGVDMAFARWYPTQTTLPSGESLVYGGRAGMGEPISVPEKMVNGKWLPLWGANDADLMSMEGARWYYPRNWVAPNGKVFGISDNRMYFIDWQGNGAIQNAGLIPDKTRMHTSTAVMYLPGKILQVGGSTNGDTQEIGSNQAITVDVNSGKPVVENAPNMAFARVWGNSTILPTGEVFISGGSAQENKLVREAKTAEMWNPNTRQFRQLAAASTARLYHSSSILLMDGTVLTGGGGAPGPLSNQNAEIYSPAYLFDPNGNLAPRPVIENLDNAKLQYGSVARVIVGDKKDVIKRVTLLRTGVSTHSFDQSQRFLELDFTSGVDGLKITLPKSANLAPPGFYMLFILNEAGIPSVSKMITVGVGSVETNDLNARQTDADPAPAVNLSRAAKPLPIVQPALGSVTPENDATYSLISRNSQKCAAVDFSQGIANKANVFQDACSGQGNQKFKLKALANGGYNLVNVSSNRCIEVFELYDTDGRNVDQWDCYGAANQEVHLVPSVDGSYQIRYVHSNKCLDVAAMSLENGANIHQWECTGGSNQDWYFKP
ncbi:MAG: DUF1929 domain-containing protein [Proteobacteria bacterium]|nr:MAG: DUF1929 domain-containing protein [Pseudomonadota bacterium]